MQQVRLGFVGCGGICRDRHIPGFRKIDGVEFVTVANRTLASSEAAAREFAIAGAAQDWREVVAHPGVDAVVIGTWPYMHRDVSIAALDAGKHVFCQARMAMNAVEAEEMAAAARRSGKVAALCPVPFGLSVDRTIARLLREGQLGDVALVRVHSLSDVNLDHEAPMTWRKDHRLSGLNVLTLGMYVEVIHRWFGMTRSVRAASQTFTPKRRDMTGEWVEVRIPDQVLCTAVMENGTAVQYTITGMARERVEAIEIFGERATLYYDALKDKLFWVDSGGLKRHVSIAPDDAYDVRDWRVEQDFIDAIREGTPYHPDFEDGLRYMRVVQDVAEAAA